MAISKYSVALCVCWVIILPVAKGQQGQRLVNVSDVIGMTKVGTSSEDPIAQFSPNGQKFMVVLRKGNLEQNTNDYSLVLWKTQQVLNDAKPEVLVNLSSSSNRPAIHDIRWQDDSETIDFLGEHPGELQQIYSLNVSTHALKKVTNSQTNVVSYTMDGRGQNFLYATEPSEASLFEGASNREEFVVTTQTISEIVTGRKNIPTAVFEGQVQFYLQSGDSSPVNLSQKLYSPVVFHPPAMSPDGKYAVIVAIVNSIPLSWSGYLHPDIQWWTQQKRTPLASGQRTYLLQAILLNTSTREIRPLLDAPTSTSSDIEVVWAPDSRSVIVTNTFLPLDNVNPSERLTRLQQSYGAVDVQVPSGIITEISKDSVNGPVWSGANRLTFRAGESEKATAGIIFEKRGSHWSKVGEEPMMQKKTVIAQEENLNQPPKIVALDPTTLNRTLLLDLNPQFADLQFAREKVIKWRGSNGHEVSGGLYFPVQYEQGKRYPLVIQTHLFNPDRFWVDGPFSTAFAAQPLAAQGIMVLQMDEDFSESDSPREVDRELARLEGAINYLDYQGLVDINRVGVIGFSRTCLHVKFALTHSKYHLAAASVTDGVDNGYFQYLLVSGLIGVEEAFEGSNGGLPFGDGLKAWMKRAPAFNVDKVSTPLLILAPNPLSALSEWEWYAALKRLDKPVEMMVLEDGQHELQKPWDRWASLQRNVDWFVFWLANKEDADPAKAEQYRRWHKLRELQVRNQGNSASSRLD